MTSLHLTRGFRHLLWVGLLAGIVPYAAAQTAPDSTRISYGEEVITTPAAEVPLRVQREEPHLWKLGLNNFTSGSIWLDDGAYYTRYGVHLAYEHKLSKPAWTVMGEVSPASTHYHSGTGAIESRLGLRAQVAGRYYHNREGRLRRGRNTGNFSANYVSVALGAGVGRQARETVRYLIRPNGRLVALDAAVLYGVQRRLGRYGFLDLNVGASSLLSTNKLRLDVTGNLRVGVALGSWPATTCSARVGPVDQDEALRPRAYVGVQFGQYHYRVRYTGPNPYQGPVLFTPYQGHGVYSQEITGPYFYAGYHVRPRLAIQVGVHKQRVNTNTVRGTLGSSSSSGSTEERDLALPVMVRYTLTRSFLQRMQFDVIGGLVPHWSSVRYKETVYFNDGLTNEYGFQRRSFSLHATTGLSIGYGIGRRRRTQITYDCVAIKDLHSSFRGLGAVRGGVGLGVRYRFGY